MTKLDELLILHTWRMLREITRNYNLRFNTDWRKQDIVNHLSDYLNQPQQLLRIVTKLSPTALLALRAISAHHNRIPDELFEKAFGIIKPLRPWQQGENPHPWQHPESVAEQLSYMGLIYLEERNQQRYVVIPEEVSAILSEGKSANLFFIPEMPTSLYDIVMDITHLQAFIHQNQIKVHHGRWMGIWNIRALNHRLPLPDPYIITARSELQTERFRFIHYLAEISGLLTGTERYLHLTPVAWNWLTLDELAKLHVLRDGWQHDLQQGSLWSRYRLPGTPDKVDIVLNVLSQATNWTSIEELTSQITIRCIHKGITYDDPEEPDWLKELLIGPLTWAGWLELSPLGQISLLPEGQVALGTLDKQELNSHPQTGAEISVDQNRLMIRLPAPPQRPLLLPYCRLALADGYNQDQYQDSFNLQRQFSQQHYVDMRNQGYAAAWINEQLRELAQEPLAEDVLTLLRDWKRAYSGISIRMVPLLSIADLDVVDALREDRSTRKGFDQILSPHHFTLHTEELNGFVSRLKSKGYTPALDSGIQRHLEENGDSAATSTAAQSWLAMRILVGVSDLVDLPYIPTAATMDTLALDVEDQLPLLESMAISTVEQIRDALDGYDPFPAPLPDYDGTIDSTLFTALEQQQPVEIVYHTLSRGERTRRVIDPLRIEDYGGARYVIAYCHLRQEERVFRMDRIESAVLVT